MLRFHIQNQTMACTYKYKGETYDKAAMLSKIIKDNIYVEGDKLAAQKWIEEKLGNQHVEFVAGLIEGDAFGQFTSDGTILLSENFEKGTEYHEAFHRVWQTMLTPQERSVIESEISEESLTEVAKLYPNLSQSKLKEEYLAESFRDFVLNDGGIKFANNTKNFFDRLLDLIKKLFGKNKLTMTELFEAVNRGEYRNKKISYPVVITPMKSVTGFDVEESSELVRSMAQRMLSALFATPDRFQQFVKNQMPYSDILKLRDWAFMEVMGDVRDNFDLDKAYAYSLKESEFYVELNKYLSQFNIEVDVDTEKFEQDSQEKDYANYKEAFKFDDKTRFSALVKLLLASVPSSTKSNKLGLQINADWASLSSQLASKLSDTSISTDALFRELKEVNTPETDRVLEILGGTNEEFLEKSKSNPKHYLDQFYLRQEFHNAFTKHWYKFQTTAINNGKFYSFNSNLEAGDKRILNEYKNKIESDVQRIELYMKQKPGEITNVVEAYVNWRDTGKRIWDNENHLVNFEVTRLDGKDINGNTARHYLEGLSGYFENVAKNSKSTWKESFAKKFEGVEAGAEEIFDSIGGYLRQLSFIENEYRSETELSIFNVAGNKVFPVNLHTFQTTVLASLKYYTNMSEESGMEELFDLEAEGKITASEIDAILEEQEKWEDWFSRISPINEAVLRAREPYLFNSYTENSIWLKNILEQRSVPELIIYDGVSPISNDIDGKELADLDPTDLFVAFMGGLYNQGGSTGEESGNRSSRSIVYPAFKHSDRSVMYGYMFENLAPFDKVDKAEVEKEFAKNYTGYLKDQENFKKAYNNNLDLYKEVAHVNPNDKPLLTERDPSVVLKAETEKLHRALEYNGLLKLIDDKPVGISSELWEASGNNLNTALTYLTSESFVGFMEQTKLFTGNPAFYSSASNLFKRLNAQSSTGSPGTVDKVTNFYMEWLNAETASKYGVTYPKKTDGRITEIISKEVDKYVSEHAENIYKVYYDHAIENGIANPEAYANRFKRAYSKVNENDGQSWINIFAWREFYVRTEGWNKSLQRTFDIEMAILTGKENNIIQEILDRFIPIYVEEYNPDKTVEYYRENPDEAFTIYFKQFMEPMRVIKGQYAGPVKVSNGERDSYDIPTADKIFIPGVRKTSYMPLVPSMIKGTNLEKLNSLMLEEGLDILHMESGAKVGAHKRLNMYDEGGNFILDSMYREARQMGDFSYDSELDFRFMKNQVKISGKEKSKIIAATQARKNMLQNFKGPDGTWTDEALGKEYIDLHRQIVKLALDEIDELVNSDVKTFVEKIRNSLEAQNEPENVFNALALLEDEGFLEMLPNRNIVENIIFSAIGKKGIRIKQTGNAYVQVAPSMFETGMRNVYYEKNVNDSRENENLFVVESEGFNSESGEGTAFTLRYTGDVETNIPLKDRETVIANYIEKLNSLKQKQLDDIQGITGKMNVEGNFELPSGKTIYLSRYGYENIQDYKKAKFKEVEQKFSNESNIRRAEQEIPLYEDSSDIATAIVGDNGNILGGGGFVGIELPGGLRGKGLGKELYRALGEHLNKNGKTLKSDVLGHSEAAHRVWTSLVKSGEAKVVSGNLNDFDGVHYTAIFEMLPKKTEKAKALYASNELKFYLDSNGNIQEAEVMVPLPQSWIPKVFNYYKSTGEVTDGNLIKVIELLNRDMANGKFQNNVTFKGLRIPNQQVSSNDIFKVKKFFLPTVSNFVVVPAELVVKTGSDFDVDIIAYRRYTIVDDQFRYTALF